jgi:hypothetical protein
MRRIGARTARAFKPPLCFRLAQARGLRHISGVEEVPMDQRKMTEAQRAYEAKRAAKAGLSLEKWLANKEKDAAAERAQAEKAAKAEAAPKKPGFFARILEKAQKPL